MEPVVFQDYLELHHMEPVESQELHMELLEFHMLEIQALFQELEESALLEELKDIQD